MTYDINSIEGYFWSVSLCFVKSKKKSQVGENNNFKNKINIFICRLVFNC